MSFSVAHVLCVYIIGRVLLERYRTSIGPRWCKVCQGNNVTNGLVYRNVSSATNRLVSRIDISANTIKNNGNWALFRYFSKSIFFQLRIGRYLGLNTRTSVADSLLVSD